MINFNGGFVKANGIYINPDYIKTIEPYETKNGPARTNVNVQDYGVVENIKTEPDIFAQAASQAQLTGKVINLNA